MRILVPSALYSYTGCARVEADGSTLDELLDNLDQRYPGIRFRMIDEQGKIRRHIRFFLDGEMVNKLSQPVQENSELCIVQALSGG